MGVEDFPFLSKVADVLKNIYTRLIAGADTIEQTAVIAWDGFEARTPPLR